MHWTTKKPSKPGWYWYRWKPIDPPDILEVVDGLDVYYEDDTGVGKYRSVTRYDGEWSNEPIKEPEAS